MIGASTIRTGCGDAIASPPAAIAVLHDRPAELGARAACAISSFMNEPIGLSGWANAGSSRSTSVCVTSVTTGLSMPRRRQLVAERVLEHEADRALRVADRVVDRHRGHLPVGDLRAAQDEADLRPVAVRDARRSSRRRPCRRRASRSRTRRRTGRRAPCARSSRISALPPTATTASPAWSCRAPRRLARCCRASALTACAEARHRRRR